MPNVQLNIRVPQDLLDRIRSQASRERVTVSELVRRAFPEGFPTRESLASFAEAAERNRRADSKATDLTSLSLGPPPSKPGSRLKSPKVKK